MNKAKSSAVWDREGCALMFIDYQDHVLDVIFAQDRRVIELNVRTLAKMALAFEIPVILSTVGVEMGANGPTSGSSIGNYPSPMSGGKSQFLIATRSRRCKGHRSTRRRTASLSRNIRERKLNERVIVIVWVG